ncbi:hypothetical protein [Magnetospirillum sp. 64-120]|uniref:hypothetical protein n=1 Tax=Magnetospirillum sp. 64-120 TaxID=1895778 RepID=UPI000926A650|nr:hypothetical protein [Magnetospirillum sp. 64-120]OJX68191.1 MAG: hypothetical protein BGO92_05930 [Magnetospirillum sp. 64-120]
MDAVIIGKHFTDDRTRKVSITCEEMHERLLRPHRGVTLRGHGGKTLTAAEQADAHEISFRRSVYAACDITTGEVFTPRQRDCPTAGQPVRRCPRQTGGKIDSASPRHS